MFYDKILILCFSATPEVKNIFSLKYCPKIYKFYNYEKQMIDKVKQNFYDKDSIEVTSKLKILNSNKITIFLKII